MSLPHFICLSLNDTLEAIENVSKLNKMQGETGGCEFVMCVMGLGKCLPPFSCLSATYLEVLEACVSLPKPEVRIPNQPHDSCNQADAKEYSCSSTGVERNLEMREDE